MITDLKWALVLGQQTCISWVNSLSHSLRQPTALSSDTQHVPPLLSCWPHLILPWKCRPSQAEIPPSSQHRVSLWRLRVCPLFSWSYGRPKLSGFLGVDCCHRLLPFSCIIDSFLSTGSFPSTHRHALVSLFQKILSLWPQTLSCCPVLRCPFSKEFSSSPITLFTLLQSGFCPPCSPDTAPVTSAMTSTCSNPEVAFLSSLTLTQSFSKHLLATSQLIQTSFP